VDADVPEATRLAGTIEKCWPEIEGFLELGKTSARSEGYNRVIKQIKRVIRVAHGSGDPA
jgi:transposase